MAGNRLKLVIKADRTRLCRLEGIGQQRVQVRAVQVDVRRSVVGLNPVSALALDQHLAGLQVLGELAGRHDAKAAHPLLQPKVDHDPAGVGAEGDPGPDLTQRGCLFINRNAQPGLNQRQRAGQATQPGSDDCNVSVHGASLAPCCPPCLATAPPCPPSG